MRQAGAQLHRRILRSLASIGRLPHKIIRILPLGEMSRSCVAVTQFAPQTLVAESTSRRRPGPPPGITRPSASRGGPAPSTGCQGRTSAVRRAGWSWTRAACHRLQAERAAQRASRSELCVCLLCWVCPGGSTGAMLEEGPMWGTRSAPTPQSLTRAILGAHSGHALRARNLGIDEFGTAAGHSVVFGCVLRVSSTDISIHGRAWPARSPKLGRSQLWPKVGAESSDFDENWRFRR